MLKKNEVINFVLIGLMLISICAVGRSTLKNIYSAEVKAKTPGTVKLIADVNDARTVTMSNEYINIKFNSSGSAYSLLMDGKELIGSAKGFYCSVNGKDELKANSLKI